jgi:zinc protease
VLANGLEVVLHEDHSDPVVAVFLYYHVGSSREAPGKSGFAHLFEHMLFQGSAHVPDDGHFRLIQEAGGTLNGTTNQDRTNYFETLPSNRLELALWLESDRMGYLLEQVDQAALTNQQDVVRNERRQSVENEPYGLAEEALVQSLFPEGHPYHGYVIGSHADIQAARLDDVQRFFRQYYSPNNASLAIVGDVDPAVARALVERYFGTLRRGPDVPPIEAGTPPITGERRRVVRARVELPRVYMAWLTPPIFQPGDAEADLTAGILGGGRSSRLYRRLVYERQIAQDVSAFQYSLALGSVFQIDATARPGHTAEELERAIDEELAALRAAPPTGDEIDRARNTIETDIVGRLERLGGVADRLNLYNHYLGTPDYLTEDVGRYRAATPVGVQRFVQEQLRSDARVVLHAVPGQPDPPAPEPPSAPDAVAAAGGESINADEPWRAEVPEPGPARPLHLPLPESAALDNGLTLILSERRGVPIVAASLVFRTGSDANPIDRPGTAAFVAEMLDEGTPTRSALEIADEVARLGASLGTGSSMDATTVSVRALSKTFPAALELLADVTLHPSFPSEEVERQRASRLAELAQRRDDPGAVAAQVTAAVLYGPGHPYGYSETGTEASVRAIARDDLVAFWRRNLVPNNAALVVAGDISMPELRALATRAFAGWQPGEPVRPDLGAPQTTSARVVIVDRPGSPQTQLRVAGIGLARSSPDFRPAQVMNLALGGLFSSRINMNLREEHGYTYGASSQFSFRRAPGPFQVGSGVRTDVTAPAVAEIFAEIRGMRAGPLPGAELTAARDSLAGSLPGAFETSAGAAGSYASVFVYDLGLDYYTRHAGQVQGVTADQAFEAARRYLVPEDLVVVAVGDRSRIEPGLRALGLGMVEFRDEEGRLAGAGTR